MSLEISDIDFKKIMSCVGYPSVPMEVLEYTEDQIKDIFIAEAVEYYFSRFPLKDSTTSLIASSSFEIDFPDDSTFGVVDARVNRRAYGGTIKTESPFMNEILFNRGESGSQRLFGINSFKGLSPIEAEIKVTQNLVTTSVIDQSSAQRIKVEISNRKVTGFVNTQGELLITWAKKSENFNDIPLKDKEYVIKLAKAKVLEAFITLRSQAISNQGEDFDTSFMEKQMDKLEREVIDKWAKRRAVVVLRG